MRQLTDYTAPSGTVSSAMAENGKQYVFYIFHGWLKTAISGWAPGNYRDEITLNTVPASTYRLEWIDPPLGP